MKDHEGDPTGQRSGGLERVPGFILSGAQWPNRRMLLRTAFRCVLKQGALKKGASGVMRPRLIVN